MVNKKVVLLGLIVVFLVTLVGAFFVWNKKRVQEATNNENLSQAEKVQTPDKNEEFVTIAYPEVNYWQTYRNEEYGFEVKYPDKFLVEEHNDSFVDNVINRYVSFSDPDTGTIISLGLRRISEKNINPRPFRTGIGGGEFFSRGTVEFGDGVAREVWNMSCDYPNENRCGAELIWFCNNKGNFENGECNNITLRNNKEAFMEVTLTEKGYLPAVYDLAHLMAQTFHTL